MRTGRPKAALMVTADERQTLEQWMRRPKTAQALARRARIVLACATGKPNHTVAAEFKTTGQTVGRWRRRFVERRLDGLLDEPRPGAPRRTSDAEVERVLARTLETMPPAATHWSSRGRWRRLAASVRAPSAASGRPSRCSRIAPRRSSSPRIRSLSRRSGTSSACI